jgi:hypothetical protein
MRDAILVSKCGDRARMKYGFRFIQSRLRFLFEVPGRIEPMLRAIKVYGGCTRCPRIWICVRNENVAYNGPVASHRYTCGCRVG